MHKKLLFAIIASIATTNAYSDQVLTSQKYVDDADAQKVNIAQGVGTNNANVGKTLVVNSSGNLELGTVSADNFVEDSITDGVTNKAPSENAVHDALENKQNKIPARQIKIDNSDTTYSPSVVTNGTTDGTIGQMAIITGARMDDDDLAWDDYINNDSLIPTLGAVGHELDRIQANIPSVTPLTWNSTTDTAAVNNYSTTFNGTTNNWPTAQSGQYVRGAVLANALALKQNKIPASDWMDGLSNTIPGVVVSTGSNGVVEQRMILDKTQDITDESIIDLVTAGYDDLSGQESSVAYDIHSNSVSANDVNNAVPTTTMTVAIANAAANSKQNKIPARQTKIRNDDAIYAPSVVTNGTTDGTIGQMAIVTNEYIGDQGDSGTEFEDYSDNVIPTAAAVSTELKMKQKKLGGGSSVAGKVVTATATAGKVTYTAIDGTVTNASNNLVTSGAVYTAVSAKQNKMTCTRWLNNIETDENCLLWELGN